MAFQSRSVTFSGKITPGNGHALHTLPHHRLILKTNNNNDDDNNLMMIYEGIMIGFVYILYVTHT